MRLIPNIEHAFELGLMMGRRRRRRANINPPLGAYGDRDMDNIIHVVMWPHVNAM